MTPRLAFIGAGRMAGAMVRGLLRKGPWEAGDLVCTSARDGTAEALSRESGIGFTYDWNALLKGADWIVLACKPQQLEDLPRDLAPASSGKRILSILAGIQLGRLREVFPKSANLVRAMPNTPGMIGEGITGYAFFQEPTTEEAEVAGRLLGALGRVVALEEPALDAVTGLSGSGPAYVFELVAALRDGGVAEGLEPGVAYQLALQTVKGAAALLEAVPESPETHRDWVSSPGGTTLAGLEIMKSRNFRTLMIDTVRAAAQRSRELSGG